MHELSIATAILEKVQSEAARRHGARFAKVGVRIGEFSGVEPNALRFGFDALVKDTPWERLALDIEYCPQMNRCSRCGQTFVVVNYEFACPGCGCRDTTFMSGDELDIVFMEVEER